MKYTKRFIKKIDPLALEDLKKLIGLRLTGLSCEQGRLLLGDLFQVNGYGEVQMHFHGEKGRSFRLSFQSGTPFSFNHENGNEVFPMKVAEVPVIPLKEYVDLKTGTIDYSKSPFPDHLRFNFHVNLQQSEGEENNLKYINIYHFISEWQDDETPEKHISDYVAFMDFGLESGKRWIFKEETSHPSFDLLFDNPEPLEAHLKIVNDDRGPTYGLPLYRLVHEIT